MRHTTLFEKILFSAPNPKNISNVSMYKTHQGNKGSQHNSTAHKSTTFFKNLAFNVPSSIPSLSKLLNGDLCSELTSLLFPDSFISLASLTILCLHLFLIAYKWKNLTYLFSNTVPEIHPYVCCM